MIYRTTEHAYQAAKFLDIEKRKFIQAFDHPRDARKAGQEPGCRADWNEIKYSVMYDLSRQKFSKEPLMGMLLETGDAYLEETNTWGDQYWGVCQGVGQNNLGKILMDVRESIRSSS